MKAFLGILAAVLAFSAVSYLALSYTHLPLAHEPPQRKELLVYCGITMIKPMTDIARVIEAQEDCRIILIKGGSGNLRKAIEMNQLGDLYLPGSDSYVQGCLDEGLVDETVFVGYNKAAIMVQEGNPRGIAGTLEDLTNPEYYVVIGDPNTGSIGKETRRILQRKGIYEAVCSNARALTTDSKYLVKVLRTKEADVVINWYATSVWDENASYVDSMTIGEEYATRKRLVLCRLTCSRYPDIAAKFMSYAASEKGIALFKKYGLYDIE